ncbi:type IV pilus modification protein PilV [Legionella impletisoli]|nr:type IV pilus modification protein PilV [Legionella impletisoli]
MNVIKRINNQAAFSLLEVLISVVVLAIGLLGIAAMQLNMIRYNHSAHMRSIAIAQANNMLDSMRANYAGVEAGQYNSISGIPADPACTNCSISEIAQRDAHIWNSYNSDLLPSGQGTVTNNGGTFTITVRWDNNRTGATGLGCSGNPLVDLTCLTMEVQL